MLEQRVIPGSLKAALNDEGFFIIPASPFIIQDERMRKRNEEIINSSLSKQ